MARVSSACATRNAGPSMFQKICVSTSSRTRPRRRPARRAGPASSVWPPSLALVCSRRCSESSLIPPLDPEELGYLYNFGRTAAASRTSPDEPRPTNRDQVRLSAGARKQKAQQRWAVSCLMLVGARGFEPPTPRSRTECSTRLSHAPTTRGSYRTSTGAVESLRIGAGADGG
jgi:hypothetical protein